MSMLIPPPTRDGVLKHLVSADDAFTPEECDRIIAAGEKFGWQAGKTGQPDKRSSSVSWLRWSTDDNWIWSRIADLAADVNRRQFRFDIASVGEYLQLTKYAAQSADRFDWHQDIGGGLLSLRKLSFVVQLNDPNDYAGGRLELFMGEQENCEPTSVNQGAIIFFPSYEPHRGTVISKGVRHSLVGWVIGPPFR